MALFELKQEYSGAEGAAPPLTFKDCAAADIDAAFFEQDEHADWHTVDGKDALVIVDDQRLKAPIGRREPSRTSTRDYIRPTQCCISA